LVVQLEVPERELWDGWWFAIPPKQSRTSRYVCALNGEGLWFGARLEREEMKKEVERC
jgi:hypothetical protein